MHIYIIFALHTTTSGKIQIQNKRELNRKTLTTFLQLLNVHFDVRMKVLFFLKKKQKFQIVATVNCGSVGKRES